MKKRIPDMTAQEVTRRLEELRLSFWAEVKFWHKQAMGQLDNHEQVRLQMGIGEENYQKFLSDDSRACSESLIRNLHTKLNCVHMRFMDCYEDFRKLMVKKAYWEASKMRNFRASTNLDRPGSYPPEADDVAF